MKIIFIDRLWINLKLYKRRKLNKTISIHHFNNYVDQILPSISWISWKTDFFLSFFRDNGITIQTSIYQIYCEIVMFLTVLIFIAIEKTLFWSRIFSFISSTMIYVIYPIFYLFGDRNFRKRVLNQGIWKALKKELFPNNSEIQPVNWFFKIEINAHN